MQIREVDVSDAARYHALRAQSDEEFPQFVGLSAEREIMAGSAGIGAIIGAYPAEGTHVFGAFEDDQLTGVLALTRRPSPSTGTRRCSGACISCRRFAARAWRKR